jgi:hypothetical protein
LRQEPFALDLHGFSEHTAACAVRYVLRYELGNYIQQDLKIVTGRGKHSLGEPVLLSRCRAPPPRRHRPLPAVNAHMPHAPSPAAAVARAAPNALPICALDGTPPPIRLPHGAPRLGCARQD